MAVAVLFVVGQLIDGNLLLGLFLGTVWLFVAGLLYHQRNQPPAPPDDRR